MLALRNNLLGSVVASGGAAPPVAVLSGIHTALYPGTVRTSVPPATTYFEANGWGYTVSAVKALVSPFLTVNWAMVPLIAMPPHSFVIFTLADLLAPVNYASRARLTLLTGHADGGIDSDVHSSATNAVDGFTGVFAGSTGDINSPGVRTSVNNGALTAAVGPFSVALALRSLEDNFEAMAGTLEFV